MCLYPRLFINKKYTETKKNKGNVPHIQDERVRYVPIGCGKCIECRRQKANEWRVRLFEEIKSSKYNYFITLTFSNESLLKISQKYELTNINDIVKKTIRLFTERYRKDYKKALKHWFITELGQNNTERIHIHGIIFSEFPINNNWLQKYWTYGHSDTGTFVNEKTINYIVKYMVKIDPKHKDYEPIILASKGIGKNYITNNKKKYHRFNENNTKDFYKLPNGNKIQLPIYYRNKLYSEDEREKLWIQKIDKDTRYINKIKIEKASKNIERVIAKLKQAQQDNLSLGYGSFGAEWKKKEYLLNLEALMGADPPNPQIFFKKK